MMFHTLRTRLKQLRNWLLEASADFPPAMIAELPDYERAQLSAEWVAPDLKPLGHVSTADPGDIIAGQPDYFTLGKYYSFCLFTSDPDEREFVEGLPCVGRTVYNDDTGVVLVILRNDDAHDQDSANQCYSAILDSLKARLDPPLSDVWERAIEQAVAADPAPIEEPPIDDEDTREL